MGLSNQLANLLSYQCWFSWREEVYATFRRAANNNSPPSTTAIVPVNRAVLGNLVTAGSPAIGREAVGVGTCVGSGAGVGLGAGGAGIGSSNVRS